MLWHMQKLVDELQAHNSSNCKMEILKKYPQCKELLRWALDPYKKFGVTSDQLEKCKDLDHALYNFIYSPSATLQLIQILTDLSSRSITGHFAIGVVNQFIKLNSEYKDLIYRIIDKDLKCRCGATLINKVYPGLIPEFDVALAKDYFKETKVDFTKKWVWSRKLDGVRCITRIENGQITFYSRKGHEFETLGNLKESLTSLKIDNCVFDGEICLMDENGNENFQDVMKEIRRKDHTIENPKYLIFDYLTLEEFDSKKSKVTLFERYNRLHEFNCRLGPTDASFEVVTQTDIDPLFPEEDIIKRLAEARSKGWEGLILRKDVPYEGKRTKNMLKVKKMYDAEYKVIWIVTGLIDDGQGNKVDGMTAVVIEHKGNRVKVGSGWTYEQRIYYEENPRELIDKIITVQYFEETTNQDGKHSLRFPIVKAIHGEKREV